MVNIFGFGDEIASSSRCESNFNHLKNRVFKNEALPIRVDRFVEHILKYYQGDHLLLNALSYEELPVKSPLSNISFLNESRNEKSICDDPITTKELRTKQNLFDVSPEELPDEIFESNSCELCNNGHKPTGLHRCNQCNKPVHLFSCSVAVKNTEEGCGEARLCLACDNICKRKENESTAVEVWKKKGNIQDRSTKLRSSKSYLNKQPGFTKIDLNQRRKITSILLLKNGSCFQNTPIFVPGLDKILLNNTCFADSILSIMAISAIESNEYNLFLNYEVKSKNKTANFG